MTRARPAPSAAAAAHPPPAGRLPRAERDDVTIIMSASLVASLRASVCSRDTDAFCRHQLADVDGEVSPDVAGKHLDLILALTKVDDATLAA
jgi:hypothetical protein